MEVRAATEEEVDRLAAIWHQGWHETHARIVPLELTGIRTLASFRDRLQGVRWRRVGTMINPMDTPEGVLPLEVWRYEKRLGDAPSG